MKVQKMSWEVFDLLSNQIAEHHRGGDIKLIVGITRGGLPLAVKLSNLLGIPMETLLWQTRDGDVQEVTKLLKLSRKYKNYEVLFVDDICDSGKTIMQINQYFKEAMFSTLMDKVPEAGLVSYAPKTYSEHNLDWIIFPWEV